ncbi:MAG: hypothetical protein WAK82_24255 [Streptosporangiaceae bacterium]
MTAAGQRVMLLGQIAGLLPGMLPGLTEQIALAAAGQAAGTVPACRALLEHLRGHPDALSSGSAQGPLSLIRLAHALAAAGTEEVVLPGCAGCGKVTASLRSWPGPGLACQSCYKDACRQPCAVCGTLARVAARGSAGPVCNRCYLRDPARHEECARCGRKRRVAYRDADGKPCCEACYPRPRRPCASCGQAREITATAAAGPVCARCYVQPPRPCGRCGRVRLIAVRARDGVPDLCATCHRGPAGECSQCGRHRILKGRRDGKPICETCYIPPPGTCGFCGQLAPITARWETGAVCVRCYPRLRARPVPCPRCGQPRVLTSLDQAGRAVCAACAGREEKYLCRRCGQPADGLARGGCSRCALQQRVDELLGEPGHATPDLGAIREALLGAANPKSVLAWLGRSNSARILAALARHDGPLTHELLDTFPRSHSRSQIRQALVHAGLLPPRQELIEDVDAWLDDLLGSVPREHAQLVRPFARWAVLRRARNRARTRTFTEASGSWARQQIRAAVDFLAWLDQRGTSLAGIGQPEIDAWLTSGASQRYSIRYFLTWAQRHHLTGLVTVPLRQARTPEQELPEDQRWHQLQHCLHQTALPLRVRVAGALLLLYGQPVSRIVQLQATQLSRHHEQAYLLFDQHPVLIPPPLADLIDQLHATATPSAVLGGRGKPASWLFPGQVPGRHLSVNGLVRQLNTCGIQARIGRSAALINLAADLPAAILADLLGLHINTAVRWVKRARRDWASYLAARTEIPRRGEAENMAHRE